MGEDDVDEFMIIVIESVGSGEHIRPVILCFLHFFFFFLVFTRVWKKCDFVTSLDERNWTAAYVGSSGIA